ncbi:MAG: glycosyltransferase family 9 protein [Candidatus Omnitrophota bacterium]
MRLNSYEHILVVNPYGIGDALFTTPLIHCLKENFPKSKIDILLGSRTKEVFEHNPAIGSIIVFDKGSFDNSGFLRKIKILTGLFKKLNRRYGLMVDLSNAPEYGFFGKFFLRIPRRVGFNYKKRGRFLTTVVPLEGFHGRHIVEFYLDLIRALDIPIGNARNLYFYIPEEVEIWGEAFLKRHDINNDTDTLIGIAPGGGESWGKDSYLKHWPPEYFAKVARFLIDTHKVKVMLFGSAHEKGLCAAIENLVEYRVVNTCGELNLTALAALFKKCKFVICNDGGPLHLAKSQGVSTVSIFGPVDSKVYGPYPPAERNIVLESPINCRPCYKNFKMPPCKTKECLLGVLPETVFEKAKLLLHNP